MNLAILSRVAALIFFLGLTGRSMADGFQLPLNNAGSWGQSPAGLATKIQSALQDSGFLNAVAAASGIAHDIAQGKVPAIDDLAKGFEGDVKNQVAASVTQATQATQLLAMLDVPVLQRLFATLQNEITTPQEFAFSIPDGRIVFRRSLLDLSLCAVIAGPGGARVTLGMSNGGRLGGNPAERFVNPTTEPVLFVDLALGYSHLQVRRKLLMPPVPGPDPAVSIQAATYFKIRDQWVQLRFAGNDPESLSLKLQFVVGARAGVSEEVQVEVEGQVMLQVEVKPTQVARMLLDITEIMKKGLASDSPASLKADPAVVAPVLKQVFDYLRTVRAGGEELGAISLVLAVDGSVGVGIAEETGINLASVGAQLTVSVPLEALVSLSADMLASQLQAGLHTSSQLVSLFEAMSEGRLDATELAKQRGVIAANAQQLGLALVGGYANYIHDIKLSAEAGVYALGDLGQVASQTVPLLVETIDIPVGQILVDGIKSVPRFVEGVTETAQAMAWMAETVINAGLRAGEPLSLGKLVTPPANPGNYVQRPRGAPPTPPTAAEWQAMAATLLDGVTISLQVGYIGIEGASLGNLVRLAGGALQVTDSLLTGALTAAVTAKEKPLLDALRAAPGQIGDDARDLLIFNLQTLSVSLKPSLGANGTVGVVAYGGIGGSIGFEGSLKSSLILLASGNTNYNEPHGTLLAGFDIPIEASASAGVRLGGPAQLTVEGGFTAGKSLASLTLKDWGQDLPVPAALTVAGFEVIDFIGTHRQNGVIEGGGWLVLPMGGLVRGDQFSLAGDGRVLGGQWSGVLELGPLGEVSLASGTITDNGLAGTSDFILGLNRLNAHFLLRSNGLLFGHATGNLGLAGLHLAADVSLDERGFLGSARTTILGAEFNSTNFRILPNGALEGSFSGTLAVDGQLLTVQNLEIRGDKLQGRTSINLAGQPAVEVLLTVDANGVIGTVVSDLDLFGAGRAHAWVRITDKIEVFGSMDGQFLGSLESVLRTRLLARIADIRETLRREKENLAAHQSDLAHFDQDLADLRNQISAERQAARAAAEKVLEDAETTLRDANALLDDAIAALSAVSGDLSRKLNDATTLFRAASSALSAAQAQVDKTNRDVANLDRWYNGLDPISKAILFVGYHAARGVMLAARDAANVVLAAARSAATAAAAALHEIERQLSAAQSLLDDKALKEQLVAEAEAAALNARRDLEAILAIAADPTLDPRYVAVVLARDAVSALIQTGEVLVAGATDILGQAAGLIDHINRYGDADLVKINQAQFRSTVADLNKGFAELIVDADIVGQPKRFVISYNFKTGQNADNIASAASLLSPQLYPGAAWTVLPWTDDGSSGLTARTLWAYHFNSAETVNVGSVAVVGLPGLSPAVPGRFSVEGFAAAYLGDQNVLTDGTGGSSKVAANFVYGENPGTVTFQGLTPGQVYRATFLSVGWDDAPITRNATFGSDADRRVVSQNAYGNNHGIRIDHTFTATAASHSVTIKPEAAETFHLYALALTADGDVPTTFNDWKQAEFGASALNPDIAGEGADPDGDGIPNFVEYALRSNPQVKNQSPLVLPMPITLPGNIVARQFTCPYQANSRDLVYRIRQSTDLRNWTDAYRLDLATGASSQLPGVSGSIDPTLQTVTVTVTDLGLFAPVSFWCLTVEKH